MLILVHTKDDLKEIKIVIGGIEMKKIRSILSCIMAAAVSATLISGCSSANMKEQDKKEVVKKDMFFMYDKNTQDVNTLSDSGEKQKIASDIQNIMYCDEMGKYILLDKDNGLYLLDSDGNKDKVASDVVFDKIQANDSSRIYYMTTDYNLYMKEKDSDKEKIASNVKDYYAPDKNSIIYIDNDNSLHVKKEDSEKYKISSSVKDFRISSTEDGYCAYVTDDSLYLKDIDNDDKEKVTDKNSGSPFEFIGNDTIAYYEDFNSETGKGELFIKKYGDDKQKIASDVVSMKPAEGGIFYINSDKAMYYKKYGEDNKEKLLDDAENIITSSDGSIFACDKDKNVYKINKDNQKEKLVVDEVSYKPSKNNLVILDKDKNLYLGSTKIGSDVTAYCVNENDVAYLNSSNEIYLSKNGQEAEKVISDAKEYEKIVFNNDTLFVNKLTPEDLKGYFKGENPNTKEAVYFNFMDNQKISMFGFDQYESTVSYTVENTSGDKITINSEGEKIEITNISSDSITLKFDNGISLNMQKIGMDEYNHMKNFTSKLYTEAVNEFGADMAYFESVQNIEGTTYYLYNTKEGDPGTGIYIDENGSRYVMRNSSLVQYGSNDNVQKNTETAGNGETFTKDKALEYARSYCQNTYSQNSGIELIPGESGYENGKAYYKVKLVSKAAKDEGGTGTMGWVKVFEDGKVYND